MSFDFLIWEMLFHLQVCRYRRDPRLQKAPVVQRDRARVKRQKRQMCTLIYLIFIAQMRDIAQVFLATENYIWHTLDRQT